MIAFAQPLRKKGQAVTAENTRVQASAMQENALSLARRGGHVTWTEGELWANQDEGNAAAGRRRRPPSPSDFSPRFFGCNAQNF